MIYKEFQDLKLSALGMGCMRLPVLNGDDAQVDETATAAMVDEAMACGAWGLSTGRDYPPSAYADPAEIIELMRHAGTASTWPTNSPAMIWPICRR